VAEFLHDADDATLALELANRFEIPAHVSLLEEPSRLWSLLSSFHWTAWENEPGDYVILIRGRRMGFSGAFGPRPVTGRRNTFAGAAALALVRKHRAERGE